MTKLKELRATYEAADDACEAARSTWKAAHDAWEDAEAARVAARDTYKAYIAEIVKQEETENEPLEISTHVPQE